VPRVTRFHPRWPDYRLLNDTIERAIAGGQRILLAGDHLAGFAHWLSRTQGDITTLDTTDLLAATPQRYAERYRRFTGSFDTCVVMLPESLLVSAGELLDRLEPFLSGKGQISIFAMNDRPLAVRQGFAREFTKESSRLQSLSRWVAEARYVPASGFRWMIYRAVQWFADQASDAAADGAPIRFFWFGLGGLPLVPIVYLLNLGTTATPLPPLRIWSSVILRLDRSEREARVSSSRFATAVAGSEPSSHSLVSARHVSGAANCGSNLAEATWENANQDPALIAR
jgi:hypothetical protein